MMRLWGMVWGVATAPLLALWLLATPAVGDTNRVASVSQGPCTVAVGIGGLYKNGAWTSVFLDQLPTNAPVTLITSDPDGAHVRFTADSSPSSPSKRRIGYVKLGRAGGTLALQSEQLAMTLTPTDEFGKPSRTPLQQFCRPVPNERPIYLVVRGDNDSDGVGLADAVALLRLPEHRRPVIATVRSLDDLPDHWCGYDAVALVVLTSSKAAFAGKKASSPQVAALADWVRLGGRLALFAGAEAGELLEGDDPPLAPFLPGRYQRMATLRQSAPITLLAGSNRPLVMTGSAETPFIRLPHFTQPRGVVLAQESDLVVASRSALGLGTITYFGGDLDAAPLRSWRDRPTLWLRLMEWNDARQSTATPQQTLIQLGYNDVSGQMRSALDAMCSVRTIPFSQILVVMVCYLVMIGVGDYFLVHKILRRPHLTWVTFPLGVAVFGGLAYWLGAVERPDRLAVHHVALCDFDTTSQTMRETFWAAAYSPHDALYDIAIPPTSVPYPSDRSHPPTTHEATRWCWLGLTGSGLGGMNPKTVTPRIWNEVYECDATQLTGVPMAVRSTKAFGGVRTTTQAAMVNPALDPHEPPTLAEEQGIPIGSVRNPFATDLDNAILLYGRWVITLGSIPAGGVVEVTSQRPRCEPRELLYRMNSADANTQAEGPPKTAASPQAVSPRVVSPRFVQYNPQSRDPHSIARVLGFYQWLGGYESVGLTNEHQSVLDMSDLLKTDRAVVMARATSAHATSGAVSRTLVRIVVPVKRAERIATEETTNPDDPLRGRDTTISAPE